MEIVTKPTEKQDKSLITPSLSPSVTNRLAEIDWSFTNRSKAPAIESIHPYPAKFIGDIPRNFIEQLSLPPETKVLDPFCGSGTTLVEAQRAGLTAVGIDLNPIACLLSRVKTSEMHPDFGSVVTEIINISKEVKSLPPSCIPNVNHWFKTDIQQAVAGLAQTIAHENYTPWLDLLRLTLSSILVRVSNQDSDTRYAAVEKKVGRDEVFEYFAAAALKLENALKNRNWSLPSVHVIEGNTLKIKPEQVGKNIGLIVTSPPYPNAYEYWLYHKYRMWWLGFDPISVKEQEIGARAHFFKKNAHTADSFVDQMRGTFSLIDSVLVKNGFICFVVGRSKIHGKIVDNGDIIQRVAHEQGLKLETRFERVIKASRKSFNLSHANIKTETMLVFQKN